MKWKVHLLVFLTAIWGIGAANAQSVYPPEISDSREPPHCNFNQSPASGHQGVWTVDSTLGGLDNINSQEAKIAILSAISRMNQQNESNVYFTYQGVANERIRARQGCGRSCNGVNTIDVDSVCDAPAYFVRRCRGNTLCVDNNVFHQWAIVFCNKYISDTDPLSTRNSDFNVGASSFSNFYDFIYIGMHELSHALGLDHPAAHISGADEYCDGDAATIGSPFCENSGHGLSGRDLYRHDLVCAEEASGVRKLTLRVLSETSGVFSSSTNKIDGTGVTSATVAHTNFLETIAIKKVVASLYASTGWRYFFSLWSQEGLIATAFGDPLIRTRRVDSMGVPGGTWDDVRFSTIDLSSTSDWRGASHVINERYTDYSTPNSTAVKSCRNDACLASDWIMSMHPIEYFDIPTSTGGSETRYGMWVQADRHVASVSYRVRIGKDMSYGGVFGPNVLLENIRSASKPTIVCDARAICALYYVPLEDRLSRIHVLLLQRDNTTGKFSKAFNVGPFVVSSDKQSSYSTGSDLVSWRRPGSNANQRTAYLAFVSQETGFPVKVLRVPLGAVVTTEVWSGGNAVTGLSVSRNVLHDSSTPVRLVWLQP